VQPLLDHPPPVIEYPAGTGGPEQASRLTPAGWHPVQLNHQHPSPLHGGIVLAATLIWINTDLINTAE